jgi:hypothetical protein
VVNTFVLDTCVLLADPRSALRFDEHDVVIPLVVVEELDRMKTRLDEVGANARAAIRLLEDLGASRDGGLREPADLPGGGSLRIELNGVTSERLPKVLDPDFELARHVPEPRGAIACLPPFVDPRHPEIAADRKLESRRHDAHDRRRLAVERERLAHDAGIAAEAALP